MVVYVAGMTMAISVTGWPDTAVPAGTVVKVVVVGVVMRFSATSRVVVCWWHQSPPLAGRRRCRGSHCVKYGITAAPDTKGSQINTVSNGLVGLVLPARRVRYGPGQPDGARRGRDDRMVTQTHIRTKPVTPRLP